MNTGRYTLCEESYPAIMIKPGETLINGKSITPGSINVVVRRADGGCYRDEVISIYDLVKFYELNS